MNHISPSSSPNSTHHSIISRSPSKTRHPKLQIPLFTMSSSAAQMNAVPPTGPVKTIQLENKIIAITGANRGPFPPIPENPPSLNPPRTDNLRRHRSRHSRLLPLQRGLQSLQPGHRHPRRRFLRPLHQVPRPTLRTASRRDERRLDPSCCRQDPRGSRGVAWDGTHAVFS